jgi:hypothetical protein
LVRTRSWVQIPSAALGDRVPRDDLSPSSVENGFRFEKKKKNEKKKKKEENGFQKQN